MSDETSSPGRLVVGRETRPKLPAYLKLRHDAGRGRWILLAPERVPGLVLQVSSFDTWYGACASFFEEGDLSH